MSAEFQADRPAVLIAAFSGRAIAAIARRAGYAPLVADLFGDVDARELASALERVPGSVGRGLGRQALIAALERLAEGRNVAGIVFGSGFEAAPESLDRIAGRYRVLGNSSATVSKVKDPEWLAAHCRRHCIPHPETTRIRPAAASGWLRKLAGASGGEHIVPAAHARRAYRRSYYQRHVGGRPVSALFVANGREHRMLGLSRQWSDPAPGRPYRYGGAVRPAFLPTPQMRVIQGAVRETTRAAELVGLNSVDFLVRDDGVDLLEINPRPGATLDIFSDRNGALFRVHMLGCNGEVSIEPLDAPAASASMLVYATKSIAVPAGFPWPDWTADRQSPGSRLPAGAPICTVLAEAVDPDGAEMLVRERAAIIRSMLDADP